MIVCTIYLIKRMFQALLVLAVVGTHAFLLRHALAYNPKIRLESDHLFHMECCSGYSTFRLVENHPCVNGYLALENDSWSSRTNCKTVESESACHIFNPQWRETI